VTGGRTCPGLRCVDGQAIIDFRAEDDDEAFAIVNETDGGLTV